MRSIVICILLAFCIVCTGCSRINEDIIVISDTYKQTNAINAGTDEVKMSMMLSDTPYDITQCKEITFINDTGADIILKKSIYVSNEKDWRTDKVIIPSMDYITNGYGTYTCKQVFEYENHGSICIEIDTSSNFKDTLTSLRRTWCVDIDDIDADGCKASFIKYIYNNTSNDEYIYYTDMNTNEEHSCIIPSGKLLMLNSSIVKRVYRKV